MVDTSRQVELRSPVRRAGSGQRADAIDQLDRRIIRHLQTNARTPNTEIARALNVTETTIRNRVNRLIDEELIEFVAIVTPKANESTLSAIMSFTVLPSSIDEATASLNERSEVRWLGQLVSTPQLWAEVFFADHESLVEFQMDYLPTIPGLQHVKTSLVAKVIKASFEWEI